MVTGGRAGHSRRGCRRRQRSGADHRGLVAAALLRKTGGAAGHHGRDGRIESPRCLDTRRDLRGYSRRMTDLSRGVRSRRSGRRPGWLLLTGLLVLGIAASSALVFTERVELLKLAVILSLWAAAVAAFVSVIYRRQSDIDRARARDLKLVHHRPLG